MFHARFRERLRQLRLERGLPQAELETAGVSLGTLQHIEQGRHQPRLETIWRLARAFGMRPAELLEVESDPAPITTARRGGPRYKGKPAGSRRQARQR